MEYRLRAMELWFQHLPGSMLIEIETEHLSKWLASTRGEHLLQIGGPSNLQMVKQAHFAHKIYLSTQFISSSHAACMQSSLEALPILPGTAATLEFSDDSDDRASSAIDSDDITNPKKAHEFVEEFQQHSGELKDISKRVAAAVAARADKPPEKRNLTVFASVHTASASQVKKVTDAGSSSNDSASDQKARSPQAKMPRT